jgi:Tfp pilus assembly protein PilX
LRSISSFSRGRTPERGFVLAAALIIAILYFALMELLLMDSARALHEAQRYRSRVIADTLAENGAELAAVQLISNPGGDVKANNSQGEMSGSLKRVGNSYLLTGDGNATGVPASTAHVELNGTTEGTNVTIVFATHDP